MAPRNSAPSSEDPHQFAVYAAEDESLPGGGRRFVAFADAQDWVSSVVVDPWWSETFPSAPIDVDVERRSATSTASVSHVAAAGDAALVKLHREHWHAVGAVHELAHIAAWSGAVAGEASHGTSFVTALLLLWRRHLGAHAYGALRSALVDRGVPFQNERLDRSTP